MTSALIFGGSGGIGAAITRRVSHRWPTIMTFERDQERAEVLASSLATRPHAVRSMRVDATVAADVAAAFTEAECLGPVEVVVDCVGGWDFPRLTELDDEAIERSLALNLRSALLVLREAARRTVEGGRVVLLSSAAAAVAPPRQITYVAAKAGLEAAARVAAKEMAPRAVTVNVVRPGATDTVTLRRTTSTPAIDAMATANAFRRLGTPDDIAGVVDLLISPDAAWVTGQVLDATGGLL